MCSAALDAAGHSFATQGDEVSYNTICDKASFTPIKTNQFAYVTESLGSKIIFDVMQDALSDGNLYVGQSIGSPKIIAMSELNDFLSYELVPFYTF